MNARDLTGAGITRALGGFRASAARAVAARADELAAVIAARDPHATVTVVPRGTEATVTASAAGLFAREFGSLDTGPDPVIGPAIEALAGARR